jgi:hypothetical protein
MGGLSLGASGVGGIYLYSHTDMKDEENPIKMDFASFFVYNGIMNSLSLKGTTGYFPQEIFGRRLWMDAVACGCLMVKRELLDEVPFFVPYGTSMTDDTAFCLKARGLGHYMIADFGVICDHWGFHVSYTPMMRLSVKLDRKMHERRRKMHLDGVYTLPEIDVNMGGRTREYVDLDVVEATSGLPP